MKNFSDIEFLSEYLDGRLTANDAAQLELRLRSDPELESALQDLRAARSFLRQLPQRKAPRNFALTRQMVGLKPPLPRAYPLFKFASAFAAALFLFSFAVHAPPLSAGFGGSAAAAPAVAMYDAGEAPAGDAAFSPESFAAPLPEEEPTAKMLQAPTEESAPLEADLPSAAPFNWTALFFIVALLGNGALLIMRYSASAKWR
ncbi:MAG: hypothetical protein LC099_05955 [Anaerolineales bacterium]|nr:hypothetical protein [Anaerolineales bacterium]